MSWLKKNITEILAISAILQFLMVILLILFKKVLTDTSTTMIILTSSTMMVTNVLQFYFGSSKGSKDKQKKLDEISDNN